jgi:hypothetical protein
MGSFLHGLPLGLRAAYVEALQIKICQPLFLNTQVF